LQRQAGNFPFGLPPLKLEVDESLSRMRLRRQLIEHGLLPVWQFTAEHGRLIRDVPTWSQADLPCLRTACGHPHHRTPELNLAFEIPPLQERQVRTSRSIGPLASLVGAEPLTLANRRLWLVYQNDGSLPFNPGSGSDQGPTAFLGLYVTFDNRRTGLSRLGWTIIDMRTPRPTLPPGAEPNSGSRYTTPAGPYSGISSIDFAVTVARKGPLKVDVLGAVGIDSTAWGQFVQDFIHKKVSNSPLLPWPKQPAKPFAELGVEALLTPDTILNRGDAYGISYEGKIELDGKLIGGTHRTEASVGARYVIRTAKVNTPFGQVSAEYSPLGAFARGFLRYNDGRETSISGVEGGLTSSAMVHIGRLGIGLKGEITVSSDAALQTGNSAGSRPVLSPLQEALGSPERLGGPAGHHGVGQAVITWSF